MVHLHATTTSTPAQAAFAVGKSVGNSVVRHQVVRRLRALTLPLLADLPAGTRIVVRALPEAATASTDELDRDLRAALARLQRVDDARPPGDAATSASQAVVDVEHHAHEDPQRTGLARIAWYAGAPLRWLMIGFVWVYRHTISPILPPTCRFHPSCSAYAFEALQVHGAAKGFALATWRVLRCNPFNLGGLDPVPPRGQWRPDILPDGQPRTPAQAVGRAA